MNARSRMRWRALLCLFPAAFSQAQPVDHDEHLHHEMPAGASATEPRVAADASSESDHVPPEPPQHSMGPMTYEAMTKLMQMDDRERTWRVLFDRLEWRTGQDSDATTWSGDAWYGGDYNKLWLKIEGEHQRGITADARAELLWDRIFARWWNVQAGVRRDFGQGPERTWAAFGVQGIAPYWFDIEATAYIGEQGRTALRLKADYDLLFTQRLILRPEAEVNVYGKPDEARGVGSGLATLDFGLRLRYEIRREFAPYAGVVWARRFGRTADLARAAGEDADALSFVAGLRIWF